MVQLTWVQLVLLWVSASAYPLQQTACPHVELTNCSFPICLFYQYDPPDEPRHLLPKTHPVASQVVKEISPQPNVTTTSNVTETAPEVMLEKTTWLGWSMEYFWVLYDNLLKPAAQQLFQAILNFSEAQIDKPVTYRYNFASSIGGAQIIAKSHKRLHSINSILINSMDNYMYTDIQMPFWVVLALRQEIVIDTIVVVSQEIYSSIVKQFSVEGSLTEEDDWTPLGNYTTANSFDTQSFPTPQKLVRYVRITFRSAYGNWRYFTLTGIQIHGRGLYSDVFAELKRKKVINGEMETCVNSFRIAEEASTNPISQVIQQIDTLEQEKQLLVRQFRQSKSRFNEKFKKLQQKLIEREMESVNHQFLKGALISLLVMLSIVVLAAVVYKRQENPKHRETSEKPKRNIKSMRDVIKISR